jgi:hypothetical protein
MLLLRDELCDLLIQPHSEPNIGFSYPPFPQKVSRQSWFRSPVGYIPVHTETWHPGQCCMLTLLYSEQPFAVSLNLNESRSTLWTDSPSPSVAKMTSFEPPRTADTYGFDSLGAVVLDIRGNGVEMFAMIVVSFSLLDWYKICRWRFAPCHSNRLCKKFRALYREPYPIFIHMDMNMT